MTLIISPSRLACWFKADAGTYQDSGLTILADFDGAMVGGWADQSGNGFNALQGVSGQRPTLRMNQLNGLPAIQFASAASQFLSLGTLLGKQRSWSLFIVMATATPNVRQSPHGSVNSGGATASSWGNAVISQLSCPAGSSAPDFGDASGNSSQTVTPGGCWTPGVYNKMSFVHRDNDASILVSKNGVVQTTTQPLLSGAYQSSGPASSFSLGREGDYNGIYLNGNIAEFILYDVNLLPADRQSVEAYLLNRWAL